MMLSLPPAQVLKLAGMNQLDYLSLEDQATLCLVEKYVKFKQGDMWRQMSEEFSAEVTVLLLLDIGYILVREILVFQ